MTTEDRTAVGERVARILVVEDAPEFVELLVPLLEREGFAPAVARDGVEALEQSAALQPDAIILDLTLPGLDGLEVCRRLRRSTDAYIVMLTSRTDEIDRVIGLEAGADDYVTKPFSPRELTARVRAMLRRPRTSTVRVGPLRLGDLEVDVEARRAHVGDEEVNLTRIEFDVLVALATRSGVVCSRQALRDEVWGQDWYGDDHLVDVHIANLRKKIDTPGAPSRITTVRGVGYRMDG